MIRLGLTGSIGMGKTTTAKLFAKQGVPGFDADVAVHELYAVGGEAVALIAKKFPKAIQNNSVNRSGLAAHLRANPTDFTILEQLVHPLVVQKRARWVERQQKAGQQVVLFDIPLLFETHSQQTVDLVILASTSAAEQRRRVLSRPGMTIDKFEQIVARQMPDAEKRKRSDYIINTGQGIEHARLQVAAVLRHIGKKDSNSK